MRSIPEALTPHESNGPVDLEAVALLRQAIARRIVGQESVLDEVLMAMLAGGHALLVGVPGLAKTLLVRTIADAMHLQFRRIQFTPDLVPSDITGAEILEEDPVTRRRSFHFVRGPLFANLVLADEINRAPPRTQAALLEAMQERAVTAAGETMPMPKPFFVLATQNPIEQEGTYPLPEAQLDRFLFDIRVGYPESAEEVEILRQTTGREAEAVEPVMTAETMITLQQLVRDTAAAGPILEYCVALVRATRPPEQSAPELVRRYLRWGAGPRAGQALVLGAKAHAVLNGRAAVAPADVQRVAASVLRHRLLTNFAAEAEGIDVERIIREVVDHVEVPQSAVRL